MFIVHHTHAEISYFHTFAPAVSSPVIYMWLNPNILQDPAQVPPPSFLISLAFTTGHTAGG